MASPPRVATRGVVPKRTRSDVMEGPTRGRVTKRTRSTPSKKGATSTRGRGTKRRRSTPSKKDGDIRFITKNEYRTFNVKGKFEDEINWLTGKGTPGGIKIEKEIHDQGSNDSCWAWCTAKLIDAAFRRAGRKIFLSVQELLDNVYPPGHSRGNLQAGLQWIKLNGGMKLADYEDEYPYTGDQLGISESPRPRPEGGKGLLDMSEAEINHDHIKAKDHGGKKPIGHSLLLVGAGTFTPTAKRLKHLIINYWILKNQWAAKFGYNGLAYLIRHSSLLKIHATNDSSEELSELLRTNFFPHYVYVSGGQARVPNKVLSIPLNEEVPMTELLDWVTNQSYAAHLLVYLFYDGSCSQPQIDADGGNAVNCAELMEALGKTYYLELISVESKVKLALIDITKHEDALSRFGFAFAEDEKMVMFAYKPQPLRNVEKGNRFHGRFNLAEIVYWLGHDLNAGHSLSS